MKWTVAGAGALLCISGIYALMTGDSIIQVERGWATFIAGAVLFSAGVVVLGMAAVVLGLLAVFKPDTCGGKAKGAGV